MHGSKQTHTHTNKQIKDQNPPPPPLFEKKAMYLEKRSDNLQ